MVMAWAKKLATGESHALVAHSLDVAAVFERLILLPVFRNRAERAAGRPLLPCDISRLGALVFLHDVGKLHPGFQAMGRPDLPVWPSGHVSHASAGCGLIRLAACQPGHPCHELVIHMASWSEEIDALLMAVFAHHGRPVRMGYALDENWPQRDGYDWRKDAAAMVQVLTSVFPEAFGPGSRSLPDAPAFVHLFAGIMALADWIGSDRRFFDFNAAPDADYPARAQRAAAVALETIGLDTVNLFLSATDFHTVAGFAEPNPAQAVIGGVDTARELVILEAETGSGKTEAALWRFARLYDAGAVSGLYFAVPTRAAAHQLHRRVNTALVRMFGANAPEAVLAIPGMRVSGLATGQKLPDFVVRWDDDQGTVPARWAAEHATRFLAATVAIGTVDQAMLAAMQVKHASMRGAALTRSLLVIDELHATDDYMTEIVTELLRGHLSAGGHALLMSATLGSRARCRFLGTSVPTFPDAVGVPYPAVWTSAQIEPDAAGGNGRKKAVAMQAHRDMDPGLVAGLAISAAQAGARVLVIRNTVAAAIHSFHAVTERGASDLLLQLGARPALHHSRFAAEDRALLDAAAEAALATAVDRTEGGRIIIGSQTLEQSLDIDADFLLTDLCPVDVLLQRIGRLHRHRLPRPAGFDEPRAVVFCPAEGLSPLTKPMFENGLGGWKNRDGTFHGIYTDLAALELTTRLISSHPVWVIPEMNRFLVESATHPHARDAVTAEMGAEWERYERDLAGKIAAARMMGQLGVLRRDAPFPEQFRSDDEKVMTRLGEQGPVLEFAPGTLGPFGRPVSRITLPAHWVHGPVPDVPLNPAPCEGGITFTVGEQAFRYTSTGLDKHY